MMNKMKVAISIAIFATAYCVAYLALRSTHFITHYSNADHWHPETRSPGHFVDTRSGMRLFDRVLKIVFCPAMLAEQVARNILG